MLLLPVPKSIIMCLFLSQSCLPVEEHDGHRVVELIHRIEIRYFLDVHDEDARLVLDVVTDIQESLVHHFAVYVVSKAEPDDLSYRMDLPQASCLLLEWPGPLPSQRAVLEANKP